MAETIKNGSTVEIILPFGMERNKGNTLYFTTDDNYEAGTSLIHEFELQEPDIFNGVFPFDLNFDSDTEQISISGRIKAIEGTSGEVDFSAGNRVEDFAALVISSVDKELSVQRKHQQEITRSASSMRKKAQRSLIGGVSLGGAGLITNAAAENRFLDSIAYAGFVLGSILVAVGFVAANSSRVFSRQKKEVGETVRILKSLKAELANNGAKIVQLYDDEG